MPHLEILRRTSLALALASPLLLPATGSAAGWPEDGDRVLPCRPTIACTADFVPPGTFEVEAGYLYKRAATGDTQRSSPLLLKLTLATWLQAQVGTNGYTVAQGEMPARFLDDVIVGLKFHLADQTATRPSLALSGAVSLPTFTGQEGYSRTYDAFFLAYGSKDVGPIHGDLNVGLDVWRLGSAPLPQEFVALALSADLVAPFGVMAEGYAFSSAAPVATRDGGFLFAFTHTPKRWLMFDLGGDVGFFPATRAYSAFVGLTVIPAVLWR
jgi:hypothetical protein